MTTPTPNNQAGTTTIIMALDYDRAVLALLTDAPDAEGLFSMKRHPVADADRSDEFFVVGCTGIPDDEGVEYVEHCQDSPNWLGTGPVPADALRALTPGDLKTLINTLSEPHLTLAGMAQVFSDLAEEMSDDDGDERIAALCHLLASALTVADHGPFGEFGSLLWVAQDALAAFSKPEIPSLASLQSIALLTWTAASVYAKSVAVEG